MSMATSLFGSFNLASLSALDQPLNDIQIEQPIASPRNTLPQGPINLGGIQGNVVGNVPSSATQQPSTSTPTTSTNIWNQAGQWMQNAATSLSNALQGGAQQTSSTLQSTASSSGTSTLVGNLMSNRLVTGVIGLIFIGAGLFMFKGTQQIVVNAGKTAAKVAAA
jgi:hypothetical protein